MNVINRKFGLGCDVLKGSYLKKVQRSICMSSLYRFGRLKTPRNPRTDLKTALYKEV